MKAGLLFLIVCTSHASRTDLKWIKWQVIHKLSRDGVGKKVKSDWKMGNMSKQNKTKQNVLDFDSKNGYFSIKLDLGYWLKNIRLIFIPKRVSFLTWPQNIFIAAMSEVRKMNLSQDLVYELIPGPNWMYSQLSMCRYNHLC